MAVGTDIGRTYSGQQGNQFATTFGPSKAIPLAAQAAAQKAASKAKARGDARDAMMKAKPEEVWHHYSAQVNKAWEDLVLKGSKIMTDKGIDDPWKSTDPDSVAWQIEMARLKSSADNINQAKDWWDKSVAGIAVRGNDYTDDYKDKVRNFAKENDFTKLASGQFALPEADFKNPSNIFSNFLVKESDRLKTDFEDRVPSDSEFATRTKQYFTSDENEVDAKAAKQMFDNLPDPAKKRFQAIAQRQGLEGGEQAMMFEDLKNRYAKPEVNVMEKALSWAKSAPKDYSKWSREDTGGVTKSGSTKDLANSSYPMEVAKGEIGSNMWWLDNEEIMAQLNVDMDVPREQRRTAAIASYSKMVKDNITKETTSGVARAAGAGISDEDIKESWPKWRLSIGSGDAEEANQSAKFLYDTKTDYGLVKDAEVIQPSMTYIVRGAGMGKTEKEHKVLRVNLNSEDDANRFKKEYLNEKYYEATLGPDATPESREALEDLISHYEDKSQGTVVEIPLIEEEEQILKTLHDAAARQKKQPFELIGDKYVKSDQPVDPLNYFSGKPKK